MWVRIWHFDFEVGGFANVVQIANNKKGPTFRLTLLDRQQERILFGRRDWTRTSDPNHIKVTSIHT